MTTINRPTSMHERAEATAGLVPRSVVKETLGCAVYAGRLLVGEGGPPSRYETCDHWAGFDRVGLLGLAAQATVKVTDLAATGVGTVVTLLAPGKFWSAPLQSLVGLCSPTNIVQTAVEAERLVGTVAAQGVACVLGAGLGFLQRRLQNWDDAFEVAFSGDASDSACAHPMPQPVGGYPGGAGEIVCPAPEPMPVEYEPVDPAEVEVPAPAEGVCVVCSNGEVICPVPVEGEPATDASRLPVQEVRTSRKLDQARKSFGP